MFKGALGNSEVVEDVRDSQLSIVVFEFKNLCMYVRCE